MSGSRNRQETHLLVEFTKPRPTIVCLCGSTRFIDAFQEAEFYETLAGKIVLTIGCDTKSDDMLGLGEDAKERLDELHKRKIELADEVLILNVNGYVGDSTRSELAHAQRLGKRVRWLQTPGPPDPPRWRDTEPVRA